MQGARTRTPPRCLAKEMLFLWVLGASHASVYGTLACCKGPQYGWYSLYWDTAQGPLERGQFFMLP